MPHEIPNQEALVKAVKKLELTSELFDEQDGKPEYATAQGEWVETFYIGVEGTLDSLGIQRAINEKSNKLQPGTCFGEMAVLAGDGQWRSKQFHAFHVQRVSSGLEIRATFRVNFRVPVVISLSIQSIAPLPRQLAVNVITGELSGEVTAC